MSFTNSIIENMKIGKTYCLSKNLACKIQYEYFEFDIFKKIQSDMWLEDQISTQQTYLSDCLFSIDIKIKPFTFILIDYIDFCTIDRYKLSDIVTLNINKGVIEKTKGYESAFEWVTQLKIISNKGVGWLLFVNNLDPADDPEFNNRFKIEELC